MEIWPLAAGCYYALWALPSWTYPVLPPFGLMELYLKKGPTPEVGPLFSSNAIYILRIETVIVGSWAIVLHSNEASDL